MRNILHKLVLIVIGLWAGIVFLELGIRILHIEKDTIWQPHPLFGWSHIPNRDGWWFSPEFKVNVKINSQGLRNRETPFAKPEGVTRILVLGDSMTEGIQVSEEQTFCSVLESMLNKATERKYEVINTGVAHFGTANELLYYQNEGYKYQADLVILAFLTTNDITDNVYEFRGNKPYFVLNANEQLELHDFPASADTSLWNQFKLWLGQNSQLYNFVSRTIHSQFPSIVRSLQSLGIARNDPGSPANAADDIDVDFLVYADRDDPMWDKAWALTRKLIVQLKIESEKHNAQFFVVVFSPQFVHVREVHWQEYMDAIPAMKDLKWDIDKPDRLIAQILQAEQIPYIQTIPYFQFAAKQNDTPLYFPADGHLTAAGHELAAQLILDYWVHSALIQK
jgi:lysophospholipase L1-like esterase